jgi:DNA modification methylase
MSEHAIELGDVIDVLRDYNDNSFDAVLCDPPYGLAFMGRKWDYDVPSVALWAEVLRVCKPGAPLLAAFGTRTYHRGVCRIEDAGWEIRDCIAWMYGSGFPKSLDVSKAIDKAAGAEREVVGKHPNPWSGYGTALKPAYEPFVLARKPLAGTVAENVARWGVGALAIDACRIEASPEDVARAAVPQPKLRPDGADSGHALGSGEGRNGERFDMSAGRWPTNVILDEEAGAALDAQTGNRPGMSGGGKHKADYAGGMFGGIDGNDKHARGDNGGASRFFYCPKANRKERDAGCEDLPALSGGQATDRDDDSPGTQNPRAGAGRTGGARNHHPTVKPIALCEYLARLIMPPSPGAILVPFAGSGSEMIGALRAGWPAVVGIERESAYVDIARRRVAALGRAA